MRRGLVPRTGFLYRFLVIALGAGILLSMLASLRADASRILPTLLSNAWEMKEVRAAGGPALPWVPGPARLKAVPNHLTKEPSQPANPAEDFQAGQQDSTDGQNPPGIYSPVAGADSQLRPSIGVDPGEPAVQEKSLPQTDIPTRLVIPSIDLDAPVVLARTLTIKIGGREFQQWKAPDGYAVGWHDSTALLGQPGNTVLNGHHNIDGKVFERLVDVNPGDLIIVYGAHRTYLYEITNKMILPEKYQELDVRMDNARWILPSDDERLTLVTCWPATSNTHRLIIVARPLGS